MKVFRTGAGSGLVNKSASCWRVLTGSNLKAPAKRWCRTKWKSISICLVRSWNTGFEAMWIAARLSEKSTALDDSSTPKSPRSCCSQINSLAAVAIARYSASADDFDTVVCFLDFQEIRDSPKKTQSPVMERRESWHVPQSASEKALSCRSEVAGYRSPNPGWDLMYRSRWWAAWRWVSLGAAMNWLSVVTKKVISMRVIVK